MTGNPEMKGFKMAIENIPAENESEKALTAAWNKNDSAISEWNRVIATSTELVGYSLYGGKDNDRTLNDLIGIPFIVQTASFRKGDNTPPETGDANTTRYDVSFSSANGETAQFPGLDLYAPEGLRRSDYPGPDGAPAA